MAAFWIATAILVILIISGMPIAFAIGLSSIAFILTTNPINIIVAPLRMFAGVNSFVLMALPLFVLAAEIMVRAGVSRRLFALVNLLVGRVRGGLAYVNVIESTVFGSISGAALSDIAALGKIEINSMLETGYDRDFACALTAVSSLQSPLIPPSTTAILYAGIMNLSVGAVLMGGAIPGVILGLSQVLYIALMGRRLKLPKVTRRYERSEIVTIWREGLIAVGMPLIILAGILLGICTPTEAAAIAVLYAVIVAVFVYRELTLKDLVAALEASAKTAATLFIIVAFASIYSWVLGSERVPEMIARFLLSMSNNRYVLLLLVNLLLIIVGMWMETGAAIILFAPILAPIMARIGVHPIHFAIVMILNLVIGLITPPVGVVLYATCAVGEISFERLNRALAPLLLISFVVLAIVTLVPDLVLFLPRLVGLIG
ncbi:MAG: TRAP transporter large permease [Firmicutes bacterium]|nr:TRAP transporter large permease [Bacillota bacterium]MDH7495368.1 TRAP transporter large permease [Bacillota bacterium]